MPFDGLQSFVQKAVKGYWKPDPNGRKWIKPKINLMRYTDDFIITAKDKETIEEIILPLVRQFMEERGLMLSEEKTKITHISKALTSSASTSANILMKSCLPSHQKMR
jgi:RNA-directed DNA polymerase